MHGFTQSIVLRTFKQISVYAQRFESGHWIFRGHERSCWPLKTTLDRALSDYGYDHSKDAELVEDRLIREFKRRAHHYSQYLPLPDDTIQWLALMRHYGAPTRLLDCTYSFWVALYFSIEPKPTKHIRSQPKRGLICSCGPAVLAIDAEAVRQKANEQLEPESGIKDLLRQSGAEKSSFKFHKYFMPYRGRPVKAMKDRALNHFVYHLNPFHLNERISAQQGVFLCPGDIRGGFDENLRALKLPRGSLTQARIRLSSSERRKALVALRRMTVSRASLFPGLGGFASSLTTLMANKKQLLDTSFTPDYSGHRLEAEEADLMRNPTQSQHP